MRPFRTAVSAAIMTAALTVLPGIASASSFSVGDITPATVDAAFTNRILTINGFGTITDVNFTITFAHCDDGIPVGSAAGVNANGDCNGTGFSFDTEIVFRLTSPGGTVVNLVSAGTYSGQIPGAGVRTVTFDDAAAAGVGGSTIVSGAFRPVDFLSILNGQEAHGDWTFFIQDTIGEDPLYYFSSTMNIETSQADVVPEPATLSLLGLGLGLAGIRLARRKTA